MAKLRLLILWPNGGTIPIQFDDELQGYELIDFLSFALKNDEEIHLVYNNHKLSELQTLQEQGIPNGAMIAVRNDTKYVQAKMLEKAKLSDLNYGILSFCREPILIEDYNDSSSEDKNEKPEFLIPPKPVQISKNPLPALWISDSFVSNDLNRFSTINPAGITFNHVDNPAETNKWNW